MPSRVFSARSLSDITLFGRTQFWHQIDSAQGPGGWAEWQDCASSAMTVLDSDGDGNEEVVSCAPCEHTGGAAQLGRNYGACSVYRGVRGGVTNKGARYLRQFKAAVKDTAEAQDYFGYSVTRGDFNRDGYADLAIGIPGEDLNGRKDAGAVAVFDGIKGGGIKTNKVDKNIILHLRLPGVRGELIANALFGYEVAAGDVDGDGTDDLIVSAVQDVVNGKVGGSIQIFYGRPGKSLSSAVNQIWTQDSPGIGESVEQGDRFGYTLVVGDFDRDGTEDIASGNPFESPGGATHAGAINVLYGSRDRQRNNNQILLTSGGLGDGTDRMFSGEAKPILFRNKRIGDSAGADDDRSSDNTMTLAKVTTALVSGLIAELTEAVVAEVLAEAP